jgi:hypothetical protein
MYNPCDSQRGRRGRGLGTWQRFAAQDVLLGAQRALGAAVPGSEEMRTWLTDPAAGLWLLRRRLRARTMSAPPMAGAALWHQARRLHVDTLQRQAFTGRLVVDRLSLEPLEELRHRSEAWGLCDHARRHRPGAPWGFQLASGASGASGGAAVSAILARRRHCLGDSLPSDIFHRSHTAKPTRAEKAPVLADSNRPA